MRTSYALSTIILLATITTQSPLAAQEPDRQATQTHIIDATATGWTWSGMEPYADPTLFKGTGRAGGPGTYAVYTFSGGSIQVYGLTGPGIDVDGVRHRLGKMRISIDGHVKGVVNVGKTEESSDRMLLELTGLPAGNHVLQLEPVDGWVVVDCLKQSAVESSDRTAPGKIVLVDRLVDFSHVAAHSPNWSIDSINGQYFNGISTRASRTRDSKEFLEYRCKALSGFQIRVYTKSPSRLAARVQIYASINGAYGQDPIDCSVRQSLDGGNGGGWTGFDLIPQTQMPDGVDAIAIVFPAGSGAAYDPELAAVSLSALN